MQPRSHIQVVEVDANGSIRRSLGTAVLVAPDVVVMRVANREAMPTLPLHVLVPVAAGGDRDEHTPVSKIFPATSGEGLVALQLKESLASDSVQVCSPQDVSTLLGSGGSGRISAVAGLDAAQPQGGFDWLCRVFRICR